MAPIYIDRPVYVSRTLRAHVGVTDFLVPSPSRWWFLNKKVF
jgi:hypothetical protein